MKTATAGFLPFEKKARILHFLGPVVAGSQLVFNQVEQRWRQDCALWNANGVREEAWILRIRFDFKCRAVLKAPDKVHHARTRATVLEIFDHSAMTNGIKSILDVDCHEHGDGGDLKPK